MLINGKEYEIKQYADLRGAYLRGANLSGANLSGAYLSVADLSVADLSGAYLRVADLRGANLSGANLSVADLRGANLSVADLSGAYLRGADLRGANLSGAYLSGAYLSGADLRGANLTDCDMSMFDIVPDTGAFVGWKKCRNGVLVKLQIPANAKRSNGTERKCRASHVKVLEVIGGEIGVSNYDSNVRYVKGNTVKAESFCTDRWEVCAPGIHFFITRKEAENYDV